MQRRVALVTSFRTFFLAFPQGLLLRGHVACTLHTAANPEEIALVTLLGSEHSFAFRLFVGKIKSCQKNSVELSVSVNRSSAS